MGGNSVGGGLVFAKRAVSEIVRSLEQNDLQKTAKSHRLQWQKKH